MNNLCWYGKDELGIECMCLADFDSNTYKLIAKKDGEQVERSFEPFGKLPKPDEHHDLVFAMDERDVQRSISISDSMARELEEKLGLVPLPMLGFAVIGQPIMLDTDIKKW